MVQKYEKKTFCDTRKKKYVIQIPLSLNKVFLEHKKIQCNANTVEHGFKVWSKELLASEPQVHVKKIRFLDLIPRVLNEKLR